MGLMLNQDLKTKVAETEQNIQTKLADYQKEIPAKDKPNLQTTRKKFRPKISKFKDLKILWQIKYQNK